MSGRLIEINTDDYHADLILPQPTLSSSVARLILNQSPLHAWTAHPRLNPHHKSTERKTFDFGRAAHRAALGKGDDWAVYPPDVLAKNGAASTAAAKAWEEQARAAGLTPIKADDEERVLAMQAKLAGVLRDYGIALAPERSEMAAVAEIDGAHCRAMFDNLPADPRLPIYDFKTTVDASPDAVLRTVMSYGYDVQGAFYRDIWHAVAGERRDFCLIMQEKEPPFEVTVVRLSGLDMDLAAERAKRARMLWAECLRNDGWPGYPRQILTLDLPEHFHARQEAKAADADRKPSREALDRARQWQAPAAS